MKPEDARSYTAAHYLDEQGKFRKKRALSETATESPQGAFHVAVSGGDKLWTLNKAKSRYSVVVKFETPVPCAESDECPIIRAWI